MYPETADSGEGSGVEQCDAELDMNGNLYRGGLCQRRPSEGFGGALLSPTACRDWRGRDRGATLPPHPPTLPVPFGGLLLGVYKLPTLGEIGQAPRAPENKAPL